MKILKFGGSSVGSAEVIKNVIEIILKARAKGEVCVVVSAFYGVTNALIEMSRLAAKGDTSYLALFKKLKNRHLETAEQLLNGSRQAGVLKNIKVIFQELEDLLRGIFLIREANAKTLDLLMSFGERLSAYIISQAVSQRQKADFFDARELIETDDNFGKARVNLTKTYQNIRRHFAVRRNLRIITGFIAANKNRETTTLGRGGSDYTAALFGAALNASEIQIWTDVDGVMTADPAKVKEAFPIKHLSYEEALELSHFGAKVIHPPTVQPALDKKIPLCIKNTFNPDWPGTLISYKIEKHPFPIKGITSTDQVALLRVQGSGLVGMVGFAKRLFGCLAEAKINIVLITQASSEYSICLAVALAEADKAKQAVEEEFKLERRAHQVDEVVAEKNLSLIAVVGENMRHTPGLAGRVFQALGKHGISVSAIAQGSSELSISFLVNRLDEARALNAIHDSFFFPNTKVVDIFMLGPGLIGSTLLRQIQEQSAFFNKNRFLEIRLVALGDSRKMAFNAGGISLRNWEKELKQSELKMDLERFVSRMKEMKTPNSIFLDCTASLAISLKYGEILQAGISIVTPNKRANAGDSQSYLRLKNLAAAANVKFLYEANAGAGLPVIGTLQNLLNSGDKVERIEAVLSGTLSYIFNSFSGKKSFSVVVAEAQANGFTEPDPRDDLNGLDVARKLLILARETGELLELEDIEVENLVPLNCQKAKTVGEFFSELKKADPLFERKRKAAEKEEKKLCYLARLEGRKAAVKLEKIDSRHPFYNLSGSDNIISFTTRRYHERPLVVQGPGAGAEVTAAGVFGDILRVADYAYSYTRLTPEEFQEKLNKNQLVLSFIGMSNVGKTLWSKKLGKVGFRHLDCDNLIERRLGKELIGEGVKGIGGVAGWLGYPYDARFQKNQEAYLSQEIGVMSKVLQDLSQGAAANTAIDTSGSVIHTGAALLSELKKHSLIIYIKTTTGMKEEMRERFFKNPKPIIWGKLYQKLKGETDRQALKRCYPDLLDFREALYERYADVTIPYDLLRGAKMSANEFLELIRGRL